MQGLHETVGDAERYSGDGNAVGVEEQGAGRGVVFGSIIFVTGGMLMLTLIAIPAGIPLFAAGPGWMLTPKDPSKR